MTWGVESEIQGLKGVFVRHYYFDVYKFSIPREWPDSALLTRVIQFNGNGSPSTQLVFNYSGMEHFVLREMIITGKRKILNFAT